MYFSEYGFLHHCFERYINQDASKDQEFIIKINPRTFLHAEFAAATVLVSFCVVLGKVSRLQLVVMTVSEIMFFSLNELIGRSVYFAFDVGDTIFLHLFAALFGLSVSRAVHHKETEGINIFC